MGWKIVQAVILALILASCRSKQNVHPIVPGNHAGRKVFIVCEGAYGNGNAALGLYLPQSDSSFEDLYKDANGTALGDVFQSMTGIGAHYFLCINNSDKIVVLDTGTLHLTATIAIPKPRYILAVSATKAYVSTLFSNKVYIINPQTFQVAGTISTPFQNPEGMTLAGGHAIICNWDTAAHSLTTIDTSADVIGVNIALPNSSPTDALPDASGMLWVLSGNVTKGRPAMISRLNPATGAVLGNFALPADADPLHLCFNGGRDTLYWIEANYNGGITNNGVYRMPVTANALPAAPFIQAQSYQYYWGLGVEQATGNIYVGNPMGFVQRGQVSIYRPDGALVKTFSTGVGPGHFFFGQ